MFDKEKLKNFFIKVRLINWNIFFEYLVNRWLVLRFLRVIVYKGKMLRGNFFVMYILMYLR